MAGKGSLAEEVRTGLEGGCMQLRLVDSPIRVDPLGELYFGKAIRQHVIEFCSIISTVLLVIALVKLYRQPLLGTPIVLAVIAVILAGVGYKAPGLVRPLWRWWMNLAEKIGAVMSLVILTLAWFIALIPIALMVRFTRSRVMDLTFEQSVTTYWQDRDGKLDDFKLLERQF